MKQGVHVGDIYMLKQAPTGAFITLMSYIVLEPANCPQSFCIVMWLDDYTKSKYLPDTIMNDVLVARYDS